jgi:hypothetical protein
MQTIDNVSYLLGDDLKSSLQKGDRLKIAAATFSIYAYEALKKELKQIEELEFIFTSPTFVPDEAVDRIKKERREFYIPKNERERSFYGTEFEIQLRNKLTQRAIAKECAEWIRAKVAFRSNKTAAPMQQFACIEKPDSDAIVYMPLNGFTAVDLGYQKGDAVSNIVNRFEEPNMTQVWLATFDQIWNDEAKLEDVTEAIIEHISTVYRENAPERIYFLMLYNIFNEFLEDLNEDVLPNDRTGFQETLIWQKLYNFQKDAATGIINKLETFNGCILADSVGLGKTFTALAVIKYYELRNRSVLVLCPKKLADNWLTYNSNLVTNIFAKDRFNYDVLNHTDLSRTRGYSHGIDLSRINWGNYDLVVIDESHNFRNAQAYKDKETRYQRLMNRIIKSGIKTKVLMLSATPVNNRFADLRNQLALAYEGESEVIRQKIGISQSIEEVFRKAQAAFNVWSKLPPEKRTAQAILDMLDFDFFKLLDSVTIARSRKHIQTFYDTSDIGTFPTRLPPISHHTPLSKREHVISFNELYTKLSEMNLSIYAPLNYVYPSRLSKYEELYDTEVKEGRSRFHQRDRERSLQALMTTNLLKRLESSVHAFRLTLQKLRKNYGDVLSQISRFEQGDKGVKIEDLPEGFTEELEEAEENWVGGKVRINLEDMDILSWKHELKNDFLILDYLLIEIDKITPDEDYKLQHLRKSVDQKVTHPINPGNKKVIIFTAFADTARYLYEQLSPHFLAAQGLHTACITGQGNPKSTLKEHYDFQSVLTLFAPKAKEKALVMPENRDEIDILIATDCISEGQNLQDCDYLINYDIHWNPVRIVQRFGRIDRIGSPNEKIQLVNYWPDITLGEYINLKERVENRMMIVDVTATGDDNVLSAKANDISYRKEQLRRLQEEVIELEDLKTGISITDLGLNEFRVDLLGYIKQHGEMGSLPNGLHTVVPADPAKGLEPGVIFTLYNRNPSVNVNRRNRLHPYYLVYIGNDGEVIADHTQAKRLLDLARAACKGRDKPIEAAYHAFNRVTRDGKDMHFYSKLLDQAIASIIGKEEENDIDSLFSGGRTTALTAKIEGLEDFELISFIVVQEADGAL